MSNEETKGMDLSTLLDANLDDIEDLPEFAVPPNGHYKLTVKLESKKVNDQECMEASYVILETLEMEAADAEPPKNGDKFSQLFMIENEFGLGNFKKFMAPFASHLETKNVRDILEFLKNDVEIFATVKQRKDKKDESKIYANVQNIQIA